MWFQGSDVAPPKITIQPTAFPEAPRDTATWRPPLSKLNGATDWVGAMTWDLGINKGCSVMNLQLVFGHFGNTETGRRGHEIANHTIDTFACMKHCQQELLWVVNSTLPSSSMCPLVAQALDTQAPPHEWNNRPCDSKSQSTVLASSVPQPVVLTRSEKFLAYCPFMPASLGTVLGRLWM